MEELNNLFHCLRGSRMIVSNGQSDFVILLPAVTGGSTAKIHINQPVRPIATSGA